MSTTEPRARDRAPWFTRRQTTVVPTPARVGMKQMYYYMVNVEEHPEVLPLAYDVVAGRLSAAAATDAYVAPPTTFSEGASALDTLLGELAKEGARLSRPWLQATDDLTRRQTLHYFTQYLPTALVDGCWLQGGLRVSTAHTNVGGSFTRLYQHQMRAVVGDSGRHFIADYRAVYTRLGNPLDELSSHAFADGLDVRDASLALPLFLLGIAQFTRSFSSELLGVNLAWHYLGLPAFGPDLIRDTCEAYGLPQLADDLGQPDYFAKGRELAREAALQYVQDAGDSAAADAWARLRRGIRAGVAVWTEWFGRVRDAAPTGAPDPRQEMIDMLWRKVPHACGYHSDRRLGAKRIDEHLEPTTFDGPALLEDLARSPWVKPGHPDRSGLLKRLIGFGGPMLSVFSPVEVQIIENWIASLPAGGDHPLESGLSDTSTGAGRARPAVLEEEYVAGPVVTPAEFRRHSESRYHGCTVRELYHYLINVEFHSDILPLAERFARDRLDRSMAMLWNGERPIPSRRYDPAALERWVYDKHRDQVKSYRPPEARPETPRHAFIEATVQLAPLILIDGGWLQGIASPALIHTTVGQMLFHVLVEELGEGKSKEHHANVYRDLLAAMGEDAPPVDSWEFARWARLNDASFEIPTLWLSISCFPRHFLPEILGLNLAVELAGVGGPYMEARDTLRHFGYPSLFVDVHNAADNVSVGHSAWAMKAITRYMDDMLTREGPHHLDHTWHRIWAGIRATLPQIGRARLIMHRVGRRLFGEDPGSIPRIFPT